MLELDQSWHFESRGPAPASLVHDFLELIKKIALQGNGWSVAERFKSCFGGTAESSSESWAWTDLDREMRQAAENGPVFINSFYAGCIRCQNELPPLPVPTVDSINTILSRHDSGYEIQPPQLVATRSYTQIIVSQQTPSLAKQARAIVDESLTRSEQLLNDGHEREAVQQILWLLETITTAFRDTGSGDATVQGKYFVSIVREMKEHGRGNAQEQILKWLMTLYGFLSSPTGGGVRHGTDLQSFNETQPHEARLYCNLTRSYINYMIEVHERLTQPPLPVSITEERS